MDIWTTLALLPPLRNLTRCSPQRPTQRRHPLFEASDDWKLQFEVFVKKDEQTKNSPFPPHIAASKCRPDGVIWSDKLKKVLWIELTSPWEESMDLWDFSFYIYPSRANKKWVVRPLLQNLVGSSNDA